MSEVEPVKLPPGLDLLWGRRERVRKGPKPGLSIDRIVSAASGLADREGLAAVSMARVAKELGNTAMSLYRYVDSKDELLQLMWNASAEGADKIELADGDWRTRLRSWAIVQRQMIDEHPWIVQMPMGTPPLAPNSLAWMERGLGALEGTSLTGADKLGVIGMISSYSLSEARMANDAARAAERGEEYADYAALVRELADERTYPLLHAVAWSGELDDPEGVDAEWESYVFGLDRFLDGVAVLIQKRSP